MPENESVDINKKIILAKEVSEAELNELVKNIKTAITALPEIAISSDKDVLLNAITDSNDEEVMNKKDRKRLRRKIRSADEEVYMVLISNGFHSKENKEEINIIWTQLFVDSYNAVIEGLRGEGILTNVANVENTEVIEETIKDLTPEPIPEPVIDPIPEAIAEPTPVVEEAFKVQEEVPEVVVTQEVIKNPEPVTIPEPEIIPEVEVKVEPTPEVIAEPTPEAKPIVEETPVAVELVEVEAAVSTEPQTVVPEIVEEVASPVKEPVQGSVQEPVQEIVTDIQKEAVSESVDNARKISLDEQIEAQLNQTIEQTIDAQLDSYLDEEKSSVYIESNNDSGSYDSYNDDLLKNKCVEAEELAESESVQENNVAVDTTVSEEPEIAEEKPAKKKFAFGKGKKKAEAAEENEADDEEVAVAEEEPEIAEKEVTKEEIAEAMSSHEESHTFLLAMAPPPPPPPPKTFWDPDDSEYDDTPKRALEALNSITEGEKWNVPTKEGSAHEFYTIFGYNFKNIDNVIPALNNKIAELCGIENAFMIRTLIKSSAVMLGRNTKILIIHRHIAENVAVIDAIEHLSDIMENAFNNPVASVDNDNEIDSEESEVA